MSDQPNNNAIPQFVEPRKFAQKGVELSGVIPPVKLERLSEEVDVVNFVKVKVIFDLDEQHRKVITGSIETSVDRQCQRCLGTVQSAAVTDVSLVMVWDDEQAKHLSDAEPLIVEDESADLYAILEEEILLNMPYLAYHSDMCVDPGMLQSGDLDDANMEEMANPFAKLKALKISADDEPKD